MDLGATELGALRLVALPALCAAIAASALLVFVLSFDDSVTSISSRPGAERLAASLSRFFAGARRFLAGRRRRHDDHRRLTLLISLARSFR